MTKLVALILFSSVMLSGYSQSRTVELPLTMRDGYGPFKPGFGGLSPDTDDSNSPWHKSTPKIQRLPEGLTEVNSGTVDTNIHQHVYQNYLAGNITKEWYDNLQKSWNWTPDKTTLSNSPVRTKIAFAYGLDAEGVTRFVLDTNGNLDLSDDPLLTPLDMASIDGVTNKDSLAMVHGVRCVVETFVYNRIVPVEVPVFVTWMERLQMYFSNFSRHATTEYKGQKIAVSSYRDLGFNYADVALVSNEQTTKPDKVYQKGEFVDVGGDIMKIVGVNTNKNVLMLERVGASNSKQFSTQVGYAAHPFAGEEFTSRTPLSLESLRGKYVLLDFWAIWCAPCIQEFSGLRELYSKTDRSRFEIVGIVGDSEPDGLTATIKRHGVTWPQILSDEIVKLYGVTGYPTTLLLDPDGVIVAKNLRGAELEKRVLSLLGE